MTEMTDWFPPEIKPAHVGWYETQIFDARWLYEQRAWWDGRFWREEPGGQVYVFDREWRGLANQTEGA